MLRFAHPEYLTYLFALPVLAAALWFIWHLKKKGMTIFGERATVIRLIDQRSRVKFWLRGSIFILAIASLIVAYANPQLGTKFEEVTRSGIDLIVAIDVSNSMLAEDIKPNRITAAKRELMTLINRLKGDRIGIIVFAGSGYTQLPLTSDYSAALMLSDIITVGSAPTAGTAIGSAIELARESFSKEENQYKALIVITDGENHEDDPVSSAKKAVEEGIVIHTIGMGSPEGAPIPIHSGGQTTGFKTDEEGRTILTKLDAKILVEIAEAAGGTFTQATNARDNLGAVFSEIEKMEKKEFGTKQFTAYEDRFQYLVAFALLLLIVEFILSEKRNKFLARFSIFADTSERKAA